MTQSFARPLSGDELMDDESFSDLCSRLSVRTEQRHAKQEATPAPRPAPRPAPQRPAPQRPAPTKSPAPRRSPPASGTPASPLSSAALEAEIDRCSSRDAVARLATYLARSYASAAALFLVHRGVVEGLCANGLAGRPDAVLFPADAASSFGEVATSGRLFRGAPRPGGLDLRILRALGREHVREIAVLPVVLSGRVVNLLYADNGPEALGDASAAALGSVCARVAAAYERLIRERKRSA